MNEITTKALCPTRAKVAEAIYAAKRAVIEWKPTASGAMRAEVAPCGKGVVVTWRVNVRLNKGNGRPATGIDAAAAVQIAVAIDDHETGRWEARIEPGQDEGERPLILAGVEGGYPAAQNAVAENLAGYAVKTIGRRRGYVPVAIRSPLGGGDLIGLAAGGLPRNA